MQALPGGTCGTAPGRYPSAPRPPRPAAHSNPPACQAQDPRLCVHAGPGPSLPRRSGTSEQLLDSLPSRKNMLRARSQSQNTDGKPWHAWHISKNRRCFAVSAYSGLKYKAPGQCGPATAHPGHPPAAASAGKPAVPVKNLRHCLQ